MVPNGVLLLYEVLKSSGTLVDLVIMVLE